MRGEGDVNVNKHVHTHTSMSALSIQTFAQMHCGAPQFVKKKRLGSGICNTFNYIM